MRKIIIILMVALMVMGAFMALVNPANAESQSVKTVTTRSLDDGLVAYWDFDEGSGDVLHDRSGNGNDGTIYGATWVDGISGKALYFNGNSYVDIDKQDVLNFGYGDLSFTFWIKLYSITGQILWDDYNPEIQVGHDGGFYTFFHSGGCGKLGSKTHAKIDTYYFVAVTREDGVAKVYINGSYENETDASNCLCDSSDEFLMGMQGDSTEYLDGILDEVRIYNRSLSSEEIQELYSQYSVASKPSPPRNLQATAGDSYISLSWTQPSDDGGSSITEYKIYRGTYSGGETYLASVSGSVTSYTDTDVTNGQTYYYYVTAVNSVGESPYSSETHAEMAEQTSQKLIVDFRIKGYKGVLIPFRMEGDTTIYSMESGKSVNISGIVFDSDWNPVSGSRVHLSASGGNIESTAITDSEGEFTARYTAPSYQTTIHITASLGDSEISSTVEIRDTSGPIKVNVLWDTGIPDASFIYAKGAEISVTDIYGEKHVSYANRYGDAELSVPAGDVWIHAEKGGVSSETKKIYHKEGEIESVGLILKSRKSTEDTVKEYGDSKNLRIEPSKAYRVGNNPLNPWDDRTVRRGDWVEIDHIRARSLFEDRSTGFYFYKYEGKDDTSCSSEPGWRIKSISLSNKGRDIPIELYKIKMPIYEGWYENAYDGETFQSDMQSYFDNDWTNYAKEHLCSYGLGQGYFSYSLTGNYFLAPKSSLDLFSLQIQIPEDTTLQKGDLIVHIEIESCEYSGGTYVGKVSGYVNVKFSVPDDEFTAILADPPFDIEVEDNDGHKITKDENNMPEANYWSDEDTILITLPAGEYHYKLIGTSTDEYTLNISYYQNGSYVQKNYSGTIQKGEVMQGEVKAEKGKFQAVAPKSGEAEHNAPPFPLGILIAIVSAVIIVSAVVVFLIYRKRKSREPPQEPSQPHSGR